MSAFKHSFFFLVYFLVWISSNCPFCTICFKCWQQKVIIPLYLLDDIYHFITEFEHACSERSSSAGDFSIKSSQQGVCSFPYTYGICAASFTKLIVSVTNCITSTALQVWTYHKLRTSLNSKLVYQDSSHLMRWVKHFSMDNIVQLSF